jgi:hypothetical protein
MRIAKQFYHNFIDTFIESIKLVSTGKSLLNIARGEFVVK